MVEFAVFHESVAALLLEEEVSFVVVVVEQDMIDVESCNVKVVQEVNVVVE